MVWFMFIPVQGLIHPWVAGLVPEQSLEHKRVCVVRAYMTASIVIHVGGRSFVRESKIYRWNLVGLT